jgi:hypothetical protein
LKASGVAHDVDIEAFLRGQGFVSAEALETARAALEARGLTRPGKRRIAEAKLPSARAALSGMLLLACANPECVRLARAGGGGRKPVSVEAPACAVCGGSNVRRATRALAHCLTSRGVRRLLIVGGKGVQHAEIEDPLAGAGLQVRFVDGRSGSHSRRDAAPDLEWAQVLVVWGATQLPHKVSKLYTDDLPAHLRGRTVRLARRGVEAVCREVMSHFGCAAGAS